MILVSGGITLTLSSSNLLNVLDSGNIFTVNSESLRANYAGPLQLRFKFSANVAFGNEVKLVLAKNRVHDTTNTNSGF